MSETETGKREPKREVTVVANPPKTWWELLLSKVLPTETSLGHISEVHLYNIHSRSNRNWWYDKRGNRWPLRDAL